MGITPMAITDRIRTMAATTDIAIITATMVIITTDMGIKLTKDMKSTEPAWKAISEPVNYHH
jgi:hypothetical protein